MARLILATARLARPLAQAGEVVLLDPARDGLSDIGNKTGSGLPCSD